MKSANKEKKTFSMEDFEKGLMLAGLISPSTIAELNERTILEQHEKNQQGQNSKIYFRRAVLAAEIASELCNERTFGRVKFQKLVYLCEHAANMNLENRYSKFAAGPFDRKFMHGIEREFKKQNWFSVEKVKDGNITRSKYVPLANASQYKKYYSNYFEHQAHHIKYIIDLFRNLKTDETEIAATLFACHLELKAKNRTADELSLLDLFYTWSEEKKRFDKTLVLSTWRWMNEKGIIAENRFI